MFKKIGIITLTLILFFNVTMAYASEITDTRVSAIQSLLDEACSKSGVPGMSVSILHEGEVIYISSGYANREQGLVSDESTLYELASVSKAFTAVGILLLEEQGFLCMTDPIQTYLPWLTFTYNGQDVDMSVLTLNHFLHHTSGLTNSTHSALIPEGDTPDMLQKTVELLMDKELAFDLGEQFTYGTMNYDVLGLVIEAVSGKSYEEFMQVQVLQPLGLDNTYMFQEDAHATDHSAQGYRTSFFVTTPYDAPTYRGNKPAGYIISSAADMSRWMGIHIGIVQDIPEIFQSVIEKAHQADTTVAAVSGVFYAGGWDVSEDKNVISHTGGNPNFATIVTLYPLEQTGICLLSNGANTNVTQLSNNIKAILDGDAPQSYAMGTTQIFDVVGVLITVVSTLFAVLLVLFGSRRRKNTEKRQLTKKAIIGTSILALSIVAGIITLIITMTIGGGWVWLSYSLLVATIALSLLLCSLIWFVCAGTHFPQHR